MAVGHGVAIFRITGDGVGVTIHAQFYHGVNILGVTSVFYQAGEGASPVVVGAENQEIVGGFAVAQQHDGDAVGTGTVQVVFIVPYLGNGDVSSRCGFGVAVGDIYSSCCIVQGQFYLVAGGYGVYQDGGIVGQIAIAVDFNSTVGACRYARENFASGAVTGDGQGNFLIVYPFIVHQFLDHQGIGMIFATCEGTGQAFYSLGNGQFNGLPNSSENSVVGQVHFFISSVQRIAGAKEGGEGQLVVVVRTAGSNSRCFTVVGDAPTCEVVAVFSRKGQSFSGNAVGIMGPFGSCSSLFCICGQRRRIGVLQLCVGGDHTVQIPGIANAIVVVAADGKPCRSGVKGRSVGGVYQVPNIPVVVFNIERSGQGRNLYQNKVVGGRTGVREIQAVHIDGNGACAGNGEILLKSVSIKPSVAVVGGAGTLAGATDNNLGHIVAVFGDDFQGNVSHVGRASGDARIVVLQLISARSRPAGVVGIGPGNRQAIQSHRLDASTVSVGSGVTRRAGAAGGHSVPENVGIYVVSGSIQFLSDGSAAAFAGLGVPAGCSVGRYTQGHHHGKY